MRAAPALGISTEIDEDLRIATLRFSASAPTQVFTLDDELLRLEQWGADAIFAELPITSSGTPRAIEALRDRGFSFAAVLPGRGGNGADAIRLQRTSNDVSPEHVVAGLPAAEILRSLVFEDRGTVALATVG